MLKTLFAMHPNLIPSVPGFHTVEVPYSDQLPWVGHPTRGVTINLIHQLGASVVAIRIRVPYKTRGGFELAYQTRCRCGKLSEEFRNFKVQKRYKSADRSRSLTPSPLCEECQQERVSSICRDIALKDSSRSAFYAALQSSACTLLNPKVFMGESLRDETIKYSFLCRCGQSFERDAYQFKKHPYCGSCARSLRSARIKAKNGLCPKGRDYSRVLAQFEQLYPLALKVRSDNTYGTRHFRQALRNLLLYWFFWQNHQWGRRCAITGLHHSEEPTCIHHLDSIYLCPERAVALDNGVCITRALHKEFHLEFCPRLGLVRGESTLAAFELFFKEKTGKGFYISEYIANNVYQGKTLIDYFSLEVLQMRLRSKKVVAQGGELVTDITVRNTHNFCVTKGHLVVSNCLIGEGEVMDFKYVIEYLNTVKRDGRTKDDFMAQMTNDRHTGVYDPTRVYFEYADKVHIQRDYKGNEISRKIYPAAGHIKRISLLDHDTSTKHVLVGPESEEFQDMEAVNAMYHLRLAADVRPEDLGRKYVRISDKPSLSQRLSSGLTDDRTKKVIPIAAAKS